MLLVDLCFSLVDLYLGIVEQYLPTESWVLRFCQSSRLIIGYSELIYVISQLILGSSRLMADLTVSFPCSVSSLV